jgi:hypothetical protein
MILFGRLRDILILARSRLSIHGAGNCPPILAPYCRREVSFMIKDHQTLVGIIGETRQIQTKEFS